MLQHQGENRRCKEPLVGLVVVGKRRLGKTPTASEDRYFRDLLLRSQAVTIVCAPSATGDAIH